jgi:hypothetical protein
MGVGMRLKKIREKKEGKIIFKFGNNKTNNKLKLMLKKSLNLEKKKGFL